MAKKGKAKAEVATRAVPELLAWKRDGNELSEREIRFLIDGFVGGRVADYQMSAFAMAVCLRGMTARETVALTLAMRDSGTVVDLSHIAGPKIDKHSTGGVGDKVSLCLAPIVTACGVRVPMVSGRGLGHTGGTLDKLEAIPGFSVGMATSDFVRQVERLGCALIWQTQDIAPADKRLYALRDVTGTVESIPLITASILSKKLAEGIDGLVLDVKVGRGAFMKTTREARALAGSLVRVGRLAKKKVSAILTSMDEPLGRTVGNALETAEAFEVLHGKGPQDLVELTFALGAEMLRLAGKAKTTAQASTQMRDVIANGQARACMRAIIEAQGGDARTVDEPDRLPRAEHRLEVRAPRTGYVQRLDALAIGKLAVALGAGRSRADQAVDPTVGIVIGAKVGDRVAKGDVVAILHVKDRPAGALAVARYLDALSLGSQKPKKRPLILAAIR